MDDFYHLPPSRPHPIGRFLLWVFFKTFYFLRIEGREHIPPKGPFLIASNHESYFDPPMVGVGCREPVVFMAWAKLFRGPHWFSRMIRFFGAFPVDLEKPDPASFRLALNLLRNGERLVIFPEAGRQDQGGVLQELREGAVRLALHAQTPIVPVRIEGAWRAWPKTNRLPYLFKPIKLIFGPPIPPPPRGLPPVEREAATSAVMIQLREFMAGQT